MEALRNMAIQFESMCIYWTPTECKALRSDIEGGTVSAFFRPLLLEAWSTHLQYGYYLGAVKNAKSGDIPGDPVADSAPPVQEPEFDTWLGS